MSADAPPPYESITDKITERLGKNPKLEDIYKVGEQLSSVEKHVLATHIYEVPPMTEEERSKVTVGLAKSISSEEGVDILRVEANDTSRAIVNIEPEFIKLTKQLLDLDSQHTNPSEGAPRLQQHYRVSIDLILESKYFLFDDFHLHRNSIE